MAKRIERRLLAVFAHPDDETFLAGPLLAKHAAEGVTVELVCATVAAPAEQSTTPVIRRAELDRAAQVLGIHAVHHLGYRDSPMRCPEVAEPRSLTAVPLEEVTGRVLEVIKAFRPHVVVTDSAYGAYGHPDHIVIHRATVEAVARYAAGGSGPLKLYALAYPIRLVWLWVCALRGLGVDVRHLGGRHDLDLPQIVRETHPVSALIDVKPYVARRKEAGKHHRSQLVAAPLPFKLLEAAPLWLHERVFGRCALTREYPSHDSTGPETDLFAGL